MIVALDVPSLEDARALAEQSELEVVFGSDGPKLADGVVSNPLL